MRKLFLAFCLVMCISAGLLAQEKQSKPGMMEQGTMQGQKMEKMQCSMGDKMMCPMMMGKSMIPVKDGFVVMMGNKLTKYDDNLNVVKEVEIKMDMKEMMENCPMMKKEQMKEEKK
jgi:hypothetical protein